MGHEPTAWSEPRFPIDPHVAGVPYRTELSLAPLVAQWAAGGRRAAGSARGARQAHLDGFEEGFGPIHFTDSGRCGGQADAYTSTRAIPAGSACVTRMERFAVAPPYTPATTTHARKNVFTSRLPDHRPHTSPAARKPL